MKAVVRKLMKCTFIHFPLFFLIRKLIVTGFQVLNQGGTFFRYQPICTDMRRMKRQRSVKCFIPIFHFLPGNTKDQVKIIVFDPIPGKQFNCTNHIRKQMYSAKCIQQLFLAGLHSQRKTIDSQLNSHFDIFPGQRTWIRLNCKFFA